MIEILVFIAVLAGIRKRARQRCVDDTPYLVAAGVGFGLLWVAGLAGLGILALALRWLWVGAVYLFLEQFSQGGQRVEERWRCPDCMLFNDSGTLRCLCGYTHGDAVVAAPSAPVATATASGNGRETAAS